MLGGSGTIIGAFLGAILLAILSDGFPIIGVSANPLYIVFGAAILVAMIANVQLDPAAGEGTDAEMTADTPDGRPRPRARTATCSGSSTSPRSTAR